MFSSINKTPDSSVKYTGEDRPNLGIKKGMTLQEVNNKLLAVVDSYESEDGVAKSVAEIKRSIGGFDSGNLTYTGSTFNIGNNISKQGTQLLGRSANYEVKTEMGGTVVSFSVRNAVDSLPQGYAVRSIRHVLKGKAKNGNTIIAESNDRFRSVKVAAERYPLELTTNIRVGTADGEVSLIGRTSIISNLDKSSKYRLQVEDYTGEDNFVVSLNDYVEQLARKIVEIDNKASYIWDIESKVEQSEKNYVALDNKLDQLESAGSITTDEDGNITSPGDKYFTLTDRIAALLKKN